MMLVLVLMNVATEETQDFDSRYTETVSARSRLKRTAPIRQSPTIRATSSSVRRAEGHFLP